MTPLAQVLADELSRLCPQMSGVDTIAERLAVAVQAEVNRLNEIIDDLGSDVARLTREVERLRPGHAANLHRVDL